MLRTLSAIAISCITTFAFGQSRYFYKGYLVTNANDTIQGYVQDNSIPVNSRTITFKRDSVSKTTSKYETKDLAGYFYEPYNLYQRKVVASDSLFLKVLIKSYVSVYKTVLPPNELLYVEKNGELYLLEKETVEVSQNQVLVNNKYITLLKQLLGDCREIQERIDQVRLNQDAISELVVNYNKCVGQTYEAFNQRGQRHLKVTYGISLGINSNHSTVLTPASDYQNVKFDNFVTPTIGAFVDFAIFKGLLIGIDAYYSDYQSKLNNFPVPLNAYYHENVKLSFKYLDIGMVVKYELTHNKIKPYLFGGPQFGYLLSNEIDVNSTYTQRSGSYKISQIDKVKRGIIFGVGLSVRVFQEKAIRLEIGSNPGTNYDGVYPIIKHHNLLARTSFVF